MAPQQFLERRMIPVPGEAGEEIGVRSKSFGPAGHSVEQCR
jgi:hypothetical protein